MWLAQHGCKVLLLSPPNPAVPGPCLHPPLHTHTPPQELIYGTSEAPLAVSTLADSSKPLLFTMARLDRVKNLTGLVEW